MTTEASRLNVSLIEEAQEALEVEKEATGLNTADTVNRALQTYHFLMEEERNGATIMVARKGLHKVKIDSAGPSEE